MFLIKKIITLMVMPMSVGLFLGWVGLLRLRRSRGSKAGWGLACSGLLLLTLTGFSFVSTRFAAVLEGDYAPLDPPPQVGWVVVLGGGQTVSAGVPANLQLGGSSLARLIEGIRIFQTVAGSRLLLSGGAVFEDVAVAETMAQTARLLGVPEERIVMDTASRDTAEQAEAVRAIVQDEPFVLVTSALHMSRSLLLFRKKGMRPIPAPCDHLSMRSSSLSPFDFFPRAGEIAKIEALLHEALGILWARTTAKF